MLFGPVIDSFRTGVHWPSAAPRKTTYGAWLMAAPSPVNSAHTTPPLAHWSLAMWYESPTGSPLGPVADSVKAGVHESPPLVLRATRLPTATQPSSWAVKQVASAPQGGISSPQVCPPSPER